MTTVKTHTGTYDFRWYEWQRMDYIGRRKAPLRRLDLMNKFGISTPQASKDIQKFMKIWPGVWKYDMSKKQYVRDKSTWKGEA